jgi:hypothetical protein
MWLSVSKLLLKCAVVSLYSVLKQRLKCNTSKVCNCLIQFLLTMVPSVEEHHLLLHSDFLNALYMTSLYNVITHNVNKHACIQINRPK